MPIFTTRTATASRSSTCTRNDASGAASASPLRNGAFMRVMRRQRRSLLIALLLAVGWLAGVPAVAQEGARQGPREAPSQGPSNWPSKPVKVVIPFGAGGTSDRFGRLVASELAKTFRQSFYVENKPGG